MHQVVDSTQSSDGYAWHRLVLTSGGRSYREYEANGNGGRYLIVLPDLDLVVVFTAGNYGQYKSGANSGTTWWLTRSSRRSEIGEPSEPAKIHADLADPRYQE